MFTKAQAKMANGILHGLLAVPDGIDTHYIFENIEHSFKTKHHLNKFVELMHENASDYFELNGLSKFEGASLMWLMPNAFTQEFLDAGGFVNQYESDKEADEQAMQLAAKEQTKFDLEAENLLLTNRLNKQRLKTHYIPIVISFISLAFAAYSLLKPSDSISQEVLDKKIESLEGQIRKLEEGYSKENKELKEKLFEADMLIGIYESDSSN